MLRMTIYNYTVFGLLSSPAIELRPRWPGGAPGFVLPPEQILPTCDEGLAAVLALRSAMPGGEAR